MINTFTKQQQNLQDHEVKYGEHPDSDRVMWSTDRLCHESIARSLRPVPMLGMGNVGAYDMSYIK